MSGTSARQLRKLLVVLGLTLLTGVILAAASGASTVPRSPAAASAGGGHQPFRSLPKSLQQTIKRNLADDATPQLGAPMSTPVATLTGSGSDGTGYAVAVSANGRTLAIGAEGGNGAIYVYKQSGGSWPSSPTAMLTDGAGSNLGSSVAISADGRTIVAGVPLAGDSDGAADVFSESGAAWISKTSPTATLTGDSGGFGTSVAASANGRTIVIGVPFAANGAGAVDEFSESGSKWASTSAPTASLAGDQGELGLSVAVSADGQTIVAGAPEAGADLQTGAVDVFTRPGSEWASAAAPAASLTDSAISDGELGSAVAVSADGDTIAVGVPNTGTYQQFVGLQGEVDVFSQSTGTWTSTTTATATMSGNAGYLGMAVAISADGQTIAAGASTAATTTTSPPSPQFDGATDYYSESNGTWPTSPTSSYDGSTEASAGTAVVLSANGQTLFSGEPGIDTVSIYGVGKLAWATTPAASLLGHAANDELGGSTVAVSADGQTVVVGVPSSGDDAGAADVYTESGGSWPSTPTAVLTGDNGALGIAVAISADGDTIVAGAPYAPSDVGGALDVFTQSGGAWVSSSTPTATLAASQSLGYSVAISADGKTIVGGAPLTGSSFNGAVDLFSEPAAGWASTNSDNTTLAGVAGTQLGTTVAISAAGTTLVSGAPFNSKKDSGAIGGRVEIFTQAAGKWPASPTMSYTGSANGLGLAVAISGEGQTVVAGSWRANKKDGLVNIYDYSPSAGTWPAAATKSYSPSGGNELGWSLAASADGQTVVAGYPFGGPSGIGAMEVYTQSGTSWSTTALTDKGLKIAGSLGYSSAISADGEEVIGGAPDVAGAGGVSNGGQLAIFQMVPAGPQITAKLTSASAKSRYGWYSKAVKVSFTCTRGAAPLSGKCSSPVTFDKSGADQTTTKTVTDTSGLTESIKVTVKIDLTKPKVKVTGVVKGHTYAGAKPKLNCVATDKVSGIASCKIAKKATWKNKAKKIRKYSYTATAVNKAGTKATASGVYYTKPKAG